MGPGDKNLLCGYSRVSNSFGEFRSFINKYRLQLPHKITFQHLSCYVKRHYDDITYLVGATETSLERLLLIWLGRACGVRSRGCKLVSGIAELEVEAGQMDGQNQQVLLFAAESRGPGG